MAILIFLQDVWIGPANFSGNKVLFEWYFLSDFWNRTDIVDKSIKIPIQLKLYVPQIQNKRVFKMKNLLIFVGK